MFCPSPNRTTPSQGTAMSDDSRVPQAALSPAEWASYPNWPDAPPIRRVADAPLYYPTRHGIAAANLYGTPEGFTHDDVAYLRGLASDPFLPHDAKAASLAERIAALLP